MLELFHQIIGRSVRRKLHGARVCHSTPSIQITGLRIPITRKLHNDEGESMKIKGGGNLLRGILQSGSISIDRRERTK